ncbi:hypothetical protein AAFP35_17820 [Gordonia sp. CPCC 206044]|uniref:hypothetical protein n=1 Tax=Gordonia sp. CPCC 206044 TaxID=3140793 RepID=UPI003AF3FE4B
MPQLWMLEDLEPWPHAPESGDICSPSTCWVHADDTELPAEVCCTVAARVEAVPFGDRIERIAHLGQGFSTAIGRGDGPTGEVELTGCLFWDHYLWIDYQTEPTGNLRITRSGCVVQHATPGPPDGYGWFTVTYGGPLEYRAAAQPVGQGYHIRWKALRVDIVTDGGTPSIQPPGRADAP